MQTDTVIPLTFEGHTVRLVRRIDNLRTPLFIRDDICLVLGIRKIPAKKAELVNSVTSIATVQTTDGYQQVAVVEMYGAARLTLPDRTPLRKRFFDWIFDEARPAFRRKLDEDMASGERVGALLAARLFMTTGENTLVDAKYIHWVTDRQIEHLRSFVLPAFDDLDDIDLRMIMARYWNVVDLGPGLVKRLARLGPLPENLCGLADAAS